MKTALLATLPSLVLAALLVWKWNDARQLQGRIDSLTAEAQSLRHEVASAQAKATPLRTTAAAAADSSENTAAGEGDPAKMKPAKNDKNPLIEFGKAMAALMQDEGSKQALKDLSAAQLAESNAELLNLLGLSPDQQKRLLDALAEAKQKDDALGLKFLAASTLSPEEKQKFLKEIEETKKANKALIEESLGDPEKIAKYDRYHDSKPERDLLAALRKPMDDKGMGLSEQQEQQMMNLIYSQRKAFPWEYDYSDETNLDPAKFSDPAIKRLWEQADEFDHQTDPGVAKILSAEQMQVYQTQRNQIRAVHKLTLNLMKGLFANSE